MHLFSLIIRRSNLAFLCLSAIWLVSCATPLDPNGSGGIITQFGVDNPNSTYVTWTNDALQSWNLGLSMGTTSLKRNMQSGRSHNPPNWITVASETKSDCLDTFGLLPEDREFICNTLSQPLVLGHCYKRYNLATGEVVDSTIVVKKEFLALTGIASSRKQAIFTHEIGHALGLQHWGNSNNDDSGLEPGGALEHLNHVMFPKSSYQETPGSEPIIAAVTPHANEIAAVQAVYTSGRSSVNPISLTNYTSCSNESNLSSGNTGVPSVSLADYQGYLPCYYGQGSGQAFFKRFYHSSFPKFTISSSIGNGYTSEAMMPPGEAVDEDNLGVEIHFLKKDGSEEVIRRPFRSE